MDKFKLLNTVTSISLLIICGLCLFHIYPSLNFKDKNSINKDLVDRSDIQDINTFFKPVISSQTCHRFLKIRNTLKDRMELSIWNPSINKKLETGAEFNSVYVKYFEAHPKHAENNLLMANLYLQIALKKDVDRIVEKNIPAFFKIEDGEIKACNVYIPKPLITES